MVNCRKVFASHYRGAEGSEAVMAEIYAEKARLEGSMPETVPSPEATLAREKVRDYKSLADMTSIELIRYHLEIWDKLQGN